MLLSLYTESKLLFRGMFVPFVQACARDSSQNETYRSRTMTHLEHSLWKKLWNQMHNNFLSRRINLYSPLHGKEKIDGRA